MTSGSFEKVVLSEHCTLRNQILFHVTPQGYHQLARESDDAEAAEPPAAAGKTPPPPTCQRAVGLMQRPHSGAFDRHCSCPPVADFADRLVGAHVTAIPRPRRQPKGAAHLTAVLEVAPECLVYQTAGEDVAEPVEAFQLAGLCVQHGYIPEFLMR